MTTLRSLCSGYEGLGLAIEAVTDATLVDHAEVDPAAIKVHDAHWPGMPNLGDITTIDWAALERTDILCAGFPCQPISQAGRRKVTNDARWLWPHIAIAVRVLRPRLVVLENVPPLLRPWRDDDGWWNPAPIEEVAGDLAALGYLGSWRCVRASDVGAPHRRERVFVVGVASNADDIGRQGPLTGPQRDARRAHRPTTDAVLAGAGWDGRAVPRAAQVARRAGVDLHAPVDGRAAAADADGQPGRGARDAERGDRPATDVRRGPAQPGGRGGAPTDADGQRRQGGSERDGVAFRPALEAPRRDDAHRLGETAWGAYGSAIRRWERALGRPAPTPTDARGRLSPAFSEWMMGLPAGWVTAVPGVSRTAQLHIIGNGVVWQQAALAIADQIPVEFRRAA